MFVVGVTGGIGSGKTTATDYFSQLGIDIVDADIASRVVVEPGRPALKEIASHFGQDILLADGSLNRAVLRQRIFTDSGEKQWLENLLHPLIGEEIQRSLENATSPYVVLVSPLLIEGEQYKRCDRVLVIDVPESLQLARTVERDNNAPDQVQRIIEAQASRKQRLEKADDVIENTGAVEDLQKQIDLLHSQYLHMASKTDKPTSGTTTVRCPVCQSQTPWSKSNPHRPFCSESCRNKDFVAWANEENTIAGDSAYGDVLSGDINPEDGEY